MAIYRPPKARWPLAIIVGVLSLLVGLGIGVLIGGDETSPAESASEIKSALVSAAGSLEVAAVEYEESVADGEVTRQQEYDGAIGAFESSRSQYDEVAPALEALAPDRAGEITGLYGECENLIDDLTDADQVGTCLNDLGRLLSGE